MSKELMGILERLYKNAMFDVIDPTIDDRNNQGNIHIQKAHTAIKELQKREVMEIKYPEILTLQLKETVEYYGHIEAFKKVWETCKEAMVKKWRGK